MSHNIAKAMAYIMKESSGDFQQDGCLYSQPVAFIEHPSTRGRPRGPQLWIFVDVILESLESWLDSEIPELIFVIHIYQIRACASHDS